jgi:hypothetical protein
MHDTGLAGQAARRQPKKAVAGLEKPHGYLYAVIPGLCRRLRIGPEISIFLDAQNAHPRSGPEPVNGPRCAARMFARNASISERNIRASRLGSD